MITLVFADDHPVARAGIRAMLNEAHDIQIVGEAENGDEVQKLVAKLQPQILLLDLKMPGPHPAELEKWVRTNFPKTATLILTAHDRDAYLAAMMEAGAAGLLRKNETAEHLISAIHRAAQGEILFDQEQVDRVRSWRKEAGNKWAKLSKRERQILMLLVQGLDGKAISSNLKIVPKTVEFHTTNILKRIGVKSHKEAVAWVHRYLPDDLDLDS